MATESKSNEITAIPQLLELLDQNYTVFTIDAAGCQKEIAAQNIAGGGDNISALQDNHPHLREDVGRQFETRHTGGFRRTDRQIVRFFNLPDPRHPWQFADFTLQGPCPLESLGGGR